MADKHGLRRVALDLHVHTPASEDWKGTSVDADRFVEAAVAAGLDGLAITDHQTGSAVDDIRKAASARGLVVFPGVELVNLAGSKGVHLIVLFDVDTTSADIERFLATVQVVRGTGARTTRGAALKGPLDVLEAVRSYGGIAVLAHCQSSKGALAEMRGDLRTQIVRHPAVMAAEAPASDFFDDEKRVNKTRTYDLLDGTDANYKRELAVYQASDNPSGAGGHGITGIGSRFTYFYVDEPLRLESLRQCFVDRDVRIQIPQPDEKPQAYLSIPVGVPHIRRLQIKGGFLDGLDISLHPALTTIVGAKGSGKSLVVELLRFALDQEPTQPDIRKDHETKLKERLRLYGRVSVTVCDQAGTEHIVAREYDPANNNPFHGIALAIREFFPCHFLSQGEIVRLAESEEEQLRFIDSFFDFHSFQREIDAITTTMADLDRQVAAQIRASKRIAELDTERATVRSQLEEKDKLLASPVFTRYQDAETKLAVLEGTIGAYSALEQVLLDSVSSAESALVPSLEPSLTADPLARRAVAALEESKRGVSEGLQKLVEAIRVARIAGAGEIEAWRPELASVREKYTEEIRRSGGDKAAISQQRAALRTQLDRLDAEYGRERQRAEQLAPTAKRRDELLAELDKKQTAYTQARVERCAWFSEKSDGRINATVAARSNVDEYRQRLTELKKGSYLSRSEIDAIVTKVEPRQLIRALLRFDLSRKDSHLEGLAQETALELDRIRQLAQFLLDGGEYEKLLNLQYSAPPTDRPEISLRLLDRTYSPLQKLSTGQKCTAMLVMALCEGNKPIVVDQPEDSLDIRSIWEDMCVRLRLSKRSRQFVFTSHNSSL